MVVHSFTVEVSETGLTLVHDFDRQMEARDIQVSSMSGGDDCYITGYDGASRTTHRWSTYYRDKWRDWVVECERLLGIMPPPTAVRGGALNLMWLYEQFLMNPLTDVQAQQHACAYILHMIDTTFFLDYSTNMAYLKWLPLLEDFDACMPCLEVVLYSHFSTRNYTKFLWRGFHSSVDIVHSYR